MKTILAVDIGNTHATLAPVTGLSVGTDLTWPSRISVDELEALILPALSAHAAADIVACSVNPRALDALEQALARHGRACVALGRDRIVPIENRANPPEKVGQDRLVNALAASRRTDGNALVVDFGTAITFDVAVDGAYAGGVITPGIGLAMEALHQKTALLPLVTPAGRPPVIGTDTEGAINSGVFYGYIGLVQNILRELISTYPQRPHVIATGGYGAYLAPEIAGIDEIIPGLTHEGIALSVQV